MDNRTAATAARIETAGRRNASGVAARKKAFVAVGRKMAWVAFLDYFRKMASVGADRKVSKETARSSAAAPFLSSVPVAAARQGSSGSGFLQR